MGIGAIHPRQAPAVRVLKVVKWYEAPTRCDAVGVRATKLASGRACPSRNALDEVRRRFNQLGQGGRPGHAITTVVFEIAGQKGRPVAPRVSACFSRRAPRVRCSPQAAWVTWPCGLADQAENRAPCPFKKGLGSGRGGFKGMAGALWCASVGGILPLGRRWRSAKPGHKTHARPE